MRQIRGLTSSENDGAYCTLHTHFTSNRPFRRSAMFTVGGLPGVRRTRTGKQGSTIAPIIVGWDSQSRALRPLNHSLL